ncbi:uncharacterized protein LOC141720363 isoform X8 [Apium graveolens]|uniref:uncharacterized protein LOC141720363 isoform X8 n=1 Tax=Apium graveolens TaxID=4045 RepID=UPI003D7A0DDA
MVEKVITESLQQRLQDLFVYRPLGHQLPCHQAAAYYYNGLMLHKDIHPFPGKELRDYSSAWLSLTLVIWFGDEIIMY